MDPSRGEAHKASPNVNAATNQKTPSNTNQPPARNAQITIMGKEPLDNNAHNQPPGEEPGGQTDKNAEVSDTTTVPKATSATCRPITTKCPKIELPSHRINAQI